MASPTSVNDDVPALAFEGITKTFGHATVLRDVSFDVKAGEIHALLGANGAGKSTLIKILAGIHHHDSGSIQVYGEPLRLGHGSAASQDARIAFVHQDLGLVEDISVADNVALQIGFEGKLGFVSGRATSARVARILASVGAKFSPDRLVNSLSRDEQVLCALARALALDPKVIILDEVSASLPAPEMQRLAASLRSLRRDGVAFIYVTHRLDELATLVDRVTVLRDGVRVLTAPIADVSHADLVRHIVGSTSHEQRPQPPARANRRADDDGGHLVVSKLTTKRLPEPISFEVRAGEVLGICGLVGCGTRELAQALGGRVRTTGGSVMLRGRPLPLNKPEVLTARRFTVVPGDRQREGILTGLGIRENLLPTRRDFGAFTRLGLRMPRHETSAVLSACTTFGVTPGDDPDRGLFALSGEISKRLCSHERSVIALTSRCWRTRQPASTSVHARCSTT